MTKDEEIKGAPLSLGKYILQFSIHIARFSRESLPWIHLSTKFCSNFEKLRKHYRTGDKHVSGMVFGRIRVLVIFASCRKLTSNNTRQCAFCKAVKDTASSCARIRRHPNENTAAAQYQCLSTASHSTHLLALTAWQAFLPGTFTARELTFIHRSSDSTVPFSGRTDHNRIVQSCPVVKRCIAPWLSGLLNSTLRIQSSWPIMVANFSNWNRGNKEFKTSNLH